MCVRGGGVVYLFSRDVEAHHDVENVPEIFLRNSPITVGVIDLKYNCRMEEVTGGVREKGVRDSIHSIFLSLVFIGC